MKTVEARGRAMAALARAIISRKVPCAGCAIFHDAEECGKDIACLSGISPEEVFDTLARFL